MHAAHQVYAFISVKSSTEGKTTFHLVMQYKQTCTIYVVRDEGKQSHLTCQLAAQQHPPPSVGHASHLP